MYLDGSYTLPVFQNEVVSRPIDGLPATAWAETYWQLKSTYRPLAYGSESSRHSRHYLVEESPPQPVGPENSMLVRFVRTFSQIPDQHIEYRLIAYTFPGVTGRFWRNGVQVWDKYAVSPPATLYRNATVLFTYSLGAPALQLPTQITYSGAPVDYCGTVYAESNTGDWVLQGATTPLSRPSDYLVSEQAERWWGPIFRRESVSVSLSTAIAQAH